MRIRQHHTIAGGKSSVIDYLYGKRRLLKERHGVKLRRIECQHPFAPKVNPVCSEGFSSPEDGALSDFLTCPTCAANTATL